MELKRSPENFFPTSPPMATRNAIAEEWLVFPLCGLEMSVLARVLDGQLCRLLADRSRHCATECSCCAKKMHSLRASLVPNNHSCESNAVNADASEYRPVRLQD